jgi:hypothetical protein
MTSQCPRCRCAPKQPQARIRQCLQCGWSDPYPWCQDPAICLHNHGESARPPTPAEATSSTSSDHDTRMRRRLANQLQAEDDLREVQYDLNGNAHPVASVPHPTSTRPKDGGLQLGLDLPPLATAYHSPAWGGTVTQPPLHEED